MADTFVTNETTSTGVTFGSDDISNVHYPRVKLIHGADGTNDGDVSSANPFPVVDSAAATLLGTIDADTSAMVTALQLIDNAVSGAGFNITQLAGAAVPIGGGTEAAALRVTIASDSTGVVTVDGTVGISGTVTVDLGTNNDVTITGDALTALQLIDNAVSGAGFNITQLGGQAVSMGTGARDAGTQRVTIATNDVVPASQSGTWNIGTVTTVTTVATVTAISNALPAGDNNIGNVDIVTLPSGNLGQQLMAASLSVVPASNITDATYIGDIKFGEALPEGTNAIGKLAANSGVDIGDVDVLSIAAGTNTIGDVGLKPRTSGGYTISRTIGAATTNATSVKGSAGQVYGIYVSNINAAPVYLKLYNLAAAPTVGTDTPVATFMVPGSTAGAGFTFWPPAGIAFATGIAFALTGAVGDADTTAVSANEQVVHIFYS